MNDRPWTDIILGNPPAQVVLSRIKEADTKTTWEMILGSSMNLLVKEHANRFQGEKSVETLQAGVAASYITYESWKGSTKFYPDPFWTLRIPVRALTLAHQALQAAVDAQEFTTFMVWNTAREAADYVWILESMEQEVIRELEFIDES